MLLFSRNQRGMAFVTLAMLMMVTNDAAMKITAHALPVSECIFLRAVMASLSALALLTARGELASIAAGANGLVALRGGLEIAGSFLFIAAVVAMPIGDANAILQIVPVLFLIVAGAMLGERIGAARIIACGIGLAGALIVAAPTGHFSFGAIFAGLTAAVVLMRELIARHLGAAIAPLALACVTMMIVVAASALGALVQTWLWPDPQQLALMLLAGALLMCGQILLTIAIRTADVQAIAPFYYTQTIFALAIGALVFGDGLEPWALLGIAMVLASGLFVFAMPGAAPKLAPGAMAAQDQQC